MKYTLSLPLTIILFACTLLSACAQRGGVSVEPIVAEPELEQPNFCEQLLKQFNAKDYQSFLLAFDSGPTIRKLELQLADNPRYQQQLPQLEKRVNYVVKQLSQSLNKFKAKRWYGINKPEQGSVCLLYSGLVDDDLSIIRVRYRKPNTGFAQITEVEELTSNISLYSRALTFINILTLSPEDDRLFSTYLNDLDKKPVKQRLEAFRLLPVEFKNQAVGLLPLFRLVDENNAPYYQPLVEEYLAAQSNHYDSFLLYSYWLTTKQYDKARAAIDRLVETIGPSVPTDLYYAELEFDLGSRKQAYRHYSDFIERNIDFEDGYWSLLGALMEDKRHEETVLTLKALESYFGYSFQGVEFNEPRMKQFSESAAYKNWVSAR